MVLRRAANVVGDTMDVKTGSSLYSRIGITHMSTAYFRMIAEDRGQARGEPSLLGVGLVAESAEWARGRSRLAGGAGWQCDQESC